MRVLILLMFFSLGFPEEQQLDAAGSELVGCVKDFLGKIDSGEIESAYSLLLGVEKLDPPQRDRIVGRLKSMQQRGSGKSEIVGHAINDIVAVVFVREPAERGDSGDPIYLRKDGDGKWKLMPGISRYAAKGLPFNEPDRAAFEKLPANNK